MEQSGDGKTPATGSRPQAQKESLWETVRSLIVIVLIVAFVRTFLWESFSIPSGSMIPTLQVGDYLWVSKYSYGYSKYSFPFSPDLFEGRMPDWQPHRGDVAVFRFTKDTSVDYVKRIVGLPGDHIQVRAGQLYLNGEAVPCAPLGHYEAIDENRTVLAGDRCRETLPGSAGSAPVVHDVLRLPDRISDFQNDTPDYVVPPGYFFAMGDDRDDSADSRFMGDGKEDLGFVPMENLVGRAGVIFFSVDGAHAWWQFWYWPQEVRWSRLFTLIR